MSLDLNASFASEILRSILASRANEATPAVDAIEIDFQDPAQTTLGRYQLLSRLGTGGMGVVYRAREAQLQRDVALKVLGASVWLDASAQTRFYQEAAAAARLHHPNIVPIFEIDQLDGIVFFTMALIEGGTLAERANGVPMDEITAARWLLPIAEALDYAHRLDVLHLDIKPANILISRSQEPQLADFGIARRLSPRTNDHGASAANTPSHNADPFTISGEIVGTPAFMAPEQATPNGVLSEATDVYGVGATLFYLLTARTVFTGDNRQAIFDQLLNKAAPDPRSVLAKQSANTISADMAAICRRCLATDPAQRYPSARALAADLDQLIKRRPVSARPITNFERLWRWAKRERALAAAIGVAFLALIGGTAISLLQAKRAVAEAERASEAAERAGKVTSFLTTMFSQASRAENRGNVPDAVQLLDAANKRITSDEFASTPLLKAELLRVMALSYHGLSRFDECIRDIDAAVELYRAALPARNDANFGTRLVELATAQSTQLMCYQRVSRLNDVIELSARYLAELQSVPEAKEQLMQLIHQRGAAQRLFNDRPGGEVTLRRLIATRADTPAQRKIVATAKVELSNILDETGRRAEAIATVRSGLDELYALDGTDSPAALGAQVNLGLLLTQEGQTAEAFVAANKGVEGLERVMGTGSMAYALAISRRGDMHTRMKQHEQALADYQAAANAAERSTGDSRQTLNYNLSVAETLVRLNRFTAADRQYQDVEQRLERTRGMIPEHLRDYLRDIALGRCAIVKADASFAPQWRTPSDPEACAKSP
jgi:eukaryotic-like serine/threonine-protein kinase